jgi:LemA protein
MTAEPWLLAAGAALVVFWILGAHNRLVALRNTIISAWAQVEEPLRRRTAMIAPLVAGLREALPDESGTLDAALAAAGRLHSAAEALRQRPASAERAASFTRAESALGAALARLLALSDAQAGPAAHAAGLRDAQQRIDFARQVFNAAVAAYNEAARQFPTRIVSRLFGFGPAGML